MQGGQVCAYARTRGDALCCIFFELTHVPGFTKVARACWSVQNPDAPLAGFGRATRTLLILLLARLWCFHVAHPFNV